MARSVFDSQQFKIRERGSFRFLTPFPLRYQEFLNHRHGLLQRIAALAVVGPIGVGSYFLAKHAGGPAVAPHVNSIEPFLLP